MADQCNYAVESENAEGQEASLFNCVSLTETGLCDSSGFVKTTILFSTEESCGEEKRSRVRRLLSDFTVLASQFNCE